MTILTGIWECSYLINYESIVDYADELIDKMNMYGQINIH